MRSEQPYSWVDYVSKVLMENDETPLLPTGVDFSWDMLSENIKETFQLEHCEIKPSEFKWREHEELWTGLGDQVSVVYAVVTPIEGHIAWGLSGEDLSRLIACMINGNQKKEQGFDHKLKEGFSHFFAIEILQSIEKMQILQSMSPRITTALDNNTPGLCMDVSITIGSDVIWSRLVISSMFRKSFSKHQLALPQVISEEKKQNTEVELSIEMGRTSLSWESWKGVRPGDFIILDNAYFDPESKKGRLHVTVGGRPILKAMLKDATIKLLEYPFYYEESVVMEEEENPSNGDELNSEQEKLPAEEGSSEEKDDFLEQESELSEGELPEGVKVEENRDLISPNDIPVTLTVEIKKLKMTMQKLFDLEPGNLLEIGVDPNSPVTLVANGKSVGTAELIKMGDVLGVRVLNIGKRNA